MEVSSPERLLKGTDIENMRSIRVTQAKIQETGERIRLRETCARTLKDKNPGRF